MGKTREERPFRSALDGPFPWNECGVGKDKQIDIHDSKLFDIAARASGLYFEELAQLTDCKDAVFCHNARFIAGAKSKESILHMAELALRS